MKHNMYSVTELSDILDLHPKTVRRFIREGKIKGTKIGRSWKVHQSDLRQYTHSELTNEVKDEVVYSPADNPDRITVSAVIEIWEKNSDEASRISNSLIALLNTKDPSWGKTRYDFIYQPEVGKARFILYGSPAFIGAIMRIFAVISTQEVS